MEQRRKDKLLLMLKSDKARSVIMLVFMISFTVILVFGKMIANGNVYMYEDIGADTKTSYFTCFNYVINCIKGGEIEVWTGEAGLGDVYYSKSSVFFEPLIMSTLMLSSIFGAQLLPYLLIVFKVVTVLISAIFCYKLLTLFSDKYYLVALTSYIYSFNGFAIIWGQHYFFSFYGMYLIIVMYYVEKFLRNKNTYFYFPLIIVSFVCLLYSPYLVYMVYLPMIFYAIIRFIGINSNFQVKYFIIKFVNLGLNIVLGFLGSLITALGTIVTMLNSGRVGNGGNAITNLINYSLIWLDPHAFLRVMQRFLSGNFEGVGANYVPFNGDNYYEAPQLFFTVFFIFFVIQYIFTLNKKCKKEMVLSMVSFLLLFLILFNYGAKYILYAFSQTSERCLFVIFPFLALMILSVLENWIYNKIYSKIGIIISTSLTMWLLGMKFGNISTQYLGENVGLLYIIDNIGFVVGMIILILLVSEKMKKGKSVLVALFCVVITVNVTAEMYVSTNRIGAVSKGAMDRIYSDNDTRKALQYIDSIDNTYYRVDKTYDDLSKYTDGLLYNYKSVSSYNSVLSNEIQEFDSNYMSNAYTYAGNILPAFFWAPYEMVQYSQLGLKYILSKEPIQDTEHYKEIANFGEVYVYENKMMNSFVSYYDTVVSEEKFCNLDYIEKNKLMSLAVAIDDSEIEELSDFVEEPQICLGKYEEKEILYSFESDLLQGKEEGLILDEDINLDRTTLNSIKGELFVEMSLCSPVKQSVFMYVDTGQGWILTHPYRIPLFANEETEVRYMLPSNTKKVKLQVESEEVMVSNLKFMETETDIAPELSTSLVYDSKYDGRIQGEIVCNCDGVMLIPIAYDEGWKAYVDGQQVKIYEANSGLMSIILETGKHNFELVYEDRYFKIGKWCLIVSIVLCGFYYFVSKKIVRNSRGE